MGIKITTLIENVVYGDSLVAEHGLSLAIETPNGMILFDTGQSGRFLENARILGIDIKKIVAVVLSHGHYDHTGGLEAFCAVNPGAEIFAKPELFVPKFKNAGTSTQKFIGTKYVPALYDKRIKWIEKTTEILPGIHVVPDIPLANAWDTHFGTMSIQTESDFVPETFADEQFLVIEEKNKIDIISGCSHRGITNIVASASGRFGLPIGLVLGGFHTKDANQTTVDMILEDLVGRDIEAIGVCHCTGVEKYPDIKKAFGAKAFYNITGKTIEL
jgi:7,8-dihydropterin-6-yl-methyl-4-(beta-D-ribofuranosyl)aminobenzene 5'-phosphate synthase